MSVRLWPYVRGAWSRDLLARLWDAIERQGAAPKLFYAQTCTEPTQRGDLAEFCAYFTDPRRTLLIAESTTRPGDLVGLFWFDDLVPGYRASGNVFYRRRYWGPVARSASRLGLAYGFTTLALQMIWAYTPWPEAASHCEAVGMRPMATLDRFILIDGRPTDVRVFRMTKEEFDG